MSETLRITCPCGYENWVPAEKRGQTVPCFICGEDLLVEEDNASPEPAAPEAGEKRSPVSRPRSPFEADDLDTAVRPKFQHAPPTPVPTSQPAARKRSPFEVDAPAEDAAFHRNEEKFVADPFSRELVPAPKPAPSITDEMEKHRPTEKRSRHVFIDSISPHDAPTGEKCMQCGRPIRGSWDRVETHLGVFCYICSNQGTQDVPDRVKTGSGRRSEIRENDLLVDPVPRAAQAPMSQSAESSTQVKRIMTVLAVGTLLVAVYVFFFDQSDSGQSAVGFTRDDLEEMPKFAVRLLNIWNLASVPFALLFGMYFALSTTDALPHESRRMNVLYLAALTVPLTAITIFLDFGASIVPVWGAILIPPAKWALIAFLLTGWMEVRITGLIALFLFYKILKGFLFPALGALVFRAFGLV